MKKQNEKLYQLVDQQMGRESIYDAMIDFEKKLISTELDLNVDSNKTLMNKIAFGILVGTITSPHHLFNVKADPADYLSKLTCPVLSLNGSNDLQVNAEINQRAIKQALMKAGNKDFKIIEMEGLNHSFQQCKTGTRMESKTLDETFSPKALELITQWIKEHVEK